MERDRLILYIDPEFILPVVTAAGGTYYEFTGSDDHCLWTYFHRDDNAGRISFGQSYRRNYYEQLAEQNYYGDIWSKITDPEGCYEFNGVRSGYINLLGSSGIIRELTTFYFTAGNGREGDISTVLIFSDAITDGARKEFIRYLGEMGFTVESYSVPLRELAITNFTEQTSLEPNAHNRVMVMQSTGGDIYISHLVCDGESYFSSTKQTRLEGMGDDPLRKILVQTVVEQLNRDTRFLNSKEEKEKEYIYQSTFVDSWINSFHNCKRSVLHLDGVALHKAKGNVKSLDIQMVAITSAVADRIFVVGKEAAGYKNAHIPTGYCGLILLGDAFSHESFAEKIGQTLGNSKLLDIYPRQAIPRILKDFPRHRAAVEKESPADYDAVMKRRQDEIATIDRWIKEGDRIKGIEDQLDNIRRKLSDLEEDIAAKVSQAESCLRSNLFPRSLSYIGEAEALCSSVKVIEEEFGKIKLEVGQVQNESHKFRNFGDASETLANIDKLYAEIVASVSRIGHDIPSELSALGDTVNYYESNFNRYKELIREALYSDRHTALGKAEEAIKITADPRANALYEKLCAGENAGEVDFSDLDITGPRGGKAPKAPKPAAAPVKPAVAERQERQDHSTRPATSGKATVEFSVKKGLFSKSKFKVTVKADGELPCPLRLFMDRMMPINRHAEGYVTIRPVEFSGGKFEHTYTFDVRKGDKKVFFRFWADDPECDGAVSMKNDNITVNI
ncbi:MAG: hypothetical protein LIO85_08780 [Rikenellaceae bacterium]|nr:hypothetical protein [Rikenellaceae bacterium]